MKRPSMQVALGIVLGAGVGTALAPPPATLRPGWVSASPSES